MARVPYHHPSDKQFSLSYVNADASETLENVVGQPGGVDVKVERYDFDEEFYAVYTNKGGGGKVENVLGDVEFKSDANKLIVLGILETAQKIYDENQEQEDEAVEQYKPTEIDKIPDALNRVDWDGTATEVAGELVSNLILVHALPNANHRTAVNMAQVYLRQIEPEFSMPETSVESSPRTYDWRDWVNEYINESKAMLTVRRKNVLLKELQQLGVSEVTRRNDVVVDLTKYELDMHYRKAHELYARRHEKLWIDFVEEAVERTDRSELKQADGISKQEFADELR